MSTKPDFVVTKCGEGVHLRFFSKRAGTVAFLLLATLVVLTPATAMTLLDINGSILSGIWGGSLSCVFTLWLVIVPKIARTAIIIEPDVVRMQQT